MRRVAITGLGLVSPLGNDAGGFFDRLMAGVSGIRRIETEFTERLTTRIAAPVDFDARSHFSAARLKGLDRYAQFALVAARQALADAALDLLDEDGARIGVYLGTALGGAQSMDEGYRVLYEQGSDRLPPYTVLMSMNAAAAGAIAGAYALSGPSLSYSTACSSASVAIGEAYRAIQA
ncbi:MAG: beta-ketoacyl synthase N-terminal-like domain-containing protein, partial [Gammaproteobacteria bacterium]